MLDIINWRWHHGTICPYRT